MVVKYDDGSRGGGPEAELTYLCDVDKGKVILNHSSGEEKAGR